MTPKKSKRKGTRRRAKRPGYESPEQTAIKHFKIGWWMIVVFATMGIVLETMHGFKVRWYLDTDNATRRMLLMLAHGLGVVFGFVHVLFAATTRCTVHWQPLHRVFSSSCLTAAGLLIPTGLILAAVYQSQEGKPGIGIILTLTGLALALLALLYTTAAPRSSVTPPRS